MAVLVLTQPLRAGDAPATRPATTFEKAIALLAAGDQIGAEKLIHQSMRQAHDRGDGPDVEETFLLGVITRSRFDIEDSTAMFNFVSQREVKAPHGRAAVSRHRSWWS
jgi:hypothetical protein